MTTARQRAIDFYQSLVPGEALPGEATEQYKDIDELVYLLSRVPTFTPRPIRIIAAGAGFSGISIARAVHVGNIPNATITVYEKNIREGGTWFENRYPGCACDIPAPNYQFSWAPNPHWSSYYATQGEIRDYIHAVTDQHGLRPYIKPAHKVTHARWIADREVWQITICKTDGRDLVISSAGVAEGESDTTFVEECEVFVNCCGFFNNWRWPDVQGREKFAGRLLHSAAWPEDADNDLDGKTVALIGNGSSGVQILPAIINRVKKVYVHVKSRTWVTAAIAQRFAGPNGSNLYYTEEQKAAWAADPKAHLEYRRMIESEINNRFSLYIDHTPSQKAAREFSVDDMTTKLRNGGKEDLLSALLPDFAVGCRRPTPGNGYLEASCHPNCEVIWGKVEGLTEDGVQTADRMTSNVDTIICATGFDLSCAPRFPIVGMDGINLRDEWLRNPAAYLSVTAANMPNYFTFMGPSSPLGHGSLVTSIEMVTKYVSAFIHKLQTQNYSNCVPKSHIPAAYQKQALAWLERTVWASNCTSTYKNGDERGALNSLHPGSRIHYFELLSTPRWEDFEWTSLCKGDDLTFAWMATGFTDRERNPKEDTNLTYVTNLALRM
ncbi:hypothetical protein BDY17DRAFT_254384 [Neohortaea acidophila]|uniref:FAD/NAD(P)-binding domain-containing protein n=1 Tax=Neohortaea acidophila TaxID=245834 RepID=A0A6A6PPM1_9PEZI|nr:uncharacterized protein BDY17DRAFT_254384 [Neohortaea acidophila]KAF2481574.1 hypothetical protein BDY17DRAFT_254384 [Neohortaea acidophila]